MAKNMREADKRGEQLGLTQDNFAFDEALGVNDSAVKVLGEPTLQQIIRELQERTTQTVLEQRHSLCAEAA